MPTPIKTAMTPKIWEGEGLGSNEVTTAAAAAAAASELVIHINLLANLQAPSNMIRALLLAMAGRLAMPSLWKLRSRREVGRQRPVGR
jgi:hypothetical protein